MPRWRVGAALALLACAAACGQGESADSQPHVFLITLESLRTDVVGAFGGSISTRPDEPVTPVLDAFARTATLYSDAHAPTSWTLASHASLFTGLYPQAHQTRVAAWADVDNDADLDLYIGNSNESNLLLRNDGGGVFTDITVGLLGDTGRADALARPDHAGPGRPVQRDRCAGAEWRFASDASSQGNRRLRPAVHGVNSDPASLRPRLHFTAPYSLCFDP